MTANEMSTELEIKLDIISSDSTPGLTDDEKSTLLTNGEFNVFKSYFPPRGFLDGYELARRELNTMYVTTNISLSAAQTDIEPNGAIYDLPTDVYHSLKVTANMTSGTECLDGKELNVKPITYDEYNTNVRNPFKQPGKDVVWVLQAPLNGSTERIQLIRSTDFTGYNSVRLSYIKKPSGITVDISTPGNQVDSLLPDIVHQEIVDNAVELAKLQLGLLDEFQAQTMFNGANK